MNTFAGLQYGIHYYGHKSSHMGKLNRSNKTFILNNILKDPFRAIYIGAWHNSSCPRTLPFYHRLDFLYLMRLLYKLPLLSWPFFIHIGLRMKFSVYRFCPDLWKWLMHCAKSCIITAQTVAVLKIIILFGLYSSHGGFVVMSTLSRDAMAIYNIHTLKAILNNIEALR